MNWWTFIELSYSRSTANIEIATLFQKSTQAEALTESDRMSPDLFDISE